MKHMHAMCMCKFMHHASWYALHSVFGIIYYIRTIGINCMWHALCLVLFYGLEDITSLGP